MKPNEYQEIDHGILDLFNEIQKKPWAFLDGEKSITRLRSFLVGYECGLAKLGFRMSGYEKLDAFQTWIGQRLSPGEPVHSWWVAVRAKTGNEEEAYNLIFELLADFSLEN